MERELVSKLEEDIKNTESIERENEALQRLVSEKEDRIKDYQNEVEGAKSQMLRLESLVQLVQENALKKQIANTPLVSTFFVTQKDIRLPVELILRF